MRLPSLRLATSLARDSSAVALIEFGYTLPVLLLLSLTGIEQTNWIITKMQLSQVALQLADNASRMGTTIQGVKNVSEVSIAEVYSGGKLQSGGLDLQTNGRVILSSIEPKANPNTTDQYRIQWQRCYGNLTNASNYGVQGDVTAAGVGVGPAGRKVKAMDGDAVMFVEVFYRYTPIFSSAVAPSATFDEIATMTVRDPRKLGVQPTSTGTAATC